jgi:hypothetical protein
VVQPLRHLVPRHIWYLDKITHYAWNRRPIPQVAKRTDIEEKKNIDCIKIRPPSINQTYYNWKTMDERNMLVTMGWKNRVRFPVKAKYVLFSSSNTPDLLKGPPTGYGGGTICLHLVPSLRTSGAIHHLALYDFKACTATTFNVLTLRHSKSRTSLVYSWDIKQRVGGLILMCRLRSLRIWLSTQCGWSHVTNKMLISPICFKRNLFF